MAASAMTLIAIVIPRWISWDTTTVSGLESSQATWRKSLTRAVWLQTAGTRIHYTYGLHRRCSSLTQTCEHFPQYDDCHGADRYFCSMWRSVGFLMSFAVVLEGMGLVALAVILAGGRQKRESGWKVTCCLLLLTGAVQCASMAIMVRHIPSGSFYPEANDANSRQTFLFDHDDRFFVGWKLDDSWVLCTASWTILMVSAVAVALSAFVLPPEGDYQLIPTTE